MIKHKTREQEIEERISDIDALCTDIWPIVEMAKAHDKGWSALSKYIEYRILPQFRNKYLSTRADDGLPYIRNQAEMQGADKVGELVQAACDLYRESFTELESLKAEQKKLREKAHKQGTRLIPKGD